MMNNFDPVIPGLISKKKILCGFTTRAGGVSPAPYDTLNLGFETPDDRSNVLKNHRIVYRHTGIDESNVALMGQVHGAGMKVVSTGGVFKETDVLLTANTGIMLGVLVADCIPLLLYDPERSVIGAVHCGWRSIAAGIAVKALEVMAEEFASDPGTMIAVLGPSAGPCCYEIKRDVARLLRTGSVHHRSGRLYADIRAELCGCLADAGIQKHKIEHFDDCTICNESLYFSHRRDGARSGRMMGYIMLV